MKVRIQDRGSVVVGGSIALLVLLCTACTSEAVDDPAPTACDGPSIYRIEAVGLPASGSGAAQVALDLDGDGVVDNRLGRLHAMLATYFADWRPDQRLSARLATGEVPWLIRIDRCDGALTIDLAQGRDDDGDGRYPLPPDTDGASGAGDRAADGIAELPLLGFTDGLGLATAPGWVSAHGVAVELRGEALGPDRDQLEAVVGVGLELDDRALTPVATFLTRHHADSAVARALDGDHDGTISVAELRASPTVAALIAADVDVDGADGVHDRVSLAFTIRARGATVD